MEGDAQGAIIAGFSKGSLVVSALLQEAAEERLRSTPASAPTNTYVFIDPGTSRPEMLFPFSAAQLAVIKHMRVAVYASAYQMCDNRSARVASAFSYVLC
jgi:alpha/beta superfamily hydrolase